MSTNSSESSPDDEQIRALVEFACELADAAAQVTLPYFRQPLSADNKSIDTQSVARGYDPVTIADRAAEQAMRELIESRYQSHGILGEEYGVKTGAAGLTWVLDPIDGTRAYIAGLPTWGTLIALFDGSIPLLGVMDQPFTGERYIAACYSDRSNTSVYQRDNTRTPVQTSSCLQLADAIMMSTAPDMFNEAEFQAQQRLVNKVRLMRYGGDCYSYCLLASGLIDLIVESDLGAYDIQALIPIVENAGGVVTDWRGGSAVHGGQVVAAATVGLHRQALELLGA